MTIYGQMDNTSGTRQTLYTVQRIYPRHKPESIHYVHVQGTFLYPSFPVQMRHIAHSITVLTRPIQDTVGISYDVLGCSCLAKHYVQDAEGHVCVCVCVCMCTCLCVCEHGRNAENADLTV